MTRKEYFKRWCATNPDKVKAAQARYKERHPERVKAAKKRWRNKNRDKHNAARRANRARNPQKYTEETRAFFLRERSTKDGSVKRLLRGAMRSGRLCAITAADILAVWPADDKCPVFNLPFAYGVKSREAGGMAPSLDRLDSALGYVSGNIAVISWRANEMKRAYSREDIAALARWIQKV